MADKKFLGLGFTFAAKDKGLEKKLINVEKRLKGISAAMGGVSRGGGGAGGIGGLSGSRSSSTARKSGAKKHASSITGSIGKLFDTGKINEKTKLMLSSVVDAFDVGGKDLKMSVDKTVGEMIVGITDKGDVASDSLKRLRKNLVVMAKGMDTTSGRVGKWYKKFKKNWIDPIGKWLGDVKGSASEFLSTIGIDFSRMIPPQATAAFKLFRDAVVTPLIKAPKALLSRFFEKGKSAQQRKLIEKISKLMDINEDFSVKIGTPTKKKTVIGRLSEMLKLMKEGGKKKGGPGLLGGLGKFAIGALLLKALTGKTFLGHIASGIAGFVKHIFSKKFLMQALKMGKIAGAFAAAAGSIFNVIDMFQTGPMKWEQELQKKFSERSVVEKILHPIDSITAILSKIVNFVLEGFQGMKDRVSEMFGSAKDKVLGFLGFDTSKQKSQKKLKSSRLRSMHEAGFGKLGEEDLSKLYSIKDSKKRAAFLNKFRGSAEDKAAAMRGSLMSREAGVPKTDTEVVASLREQNDLLRQIVAGQKNTSQNVKVQVETNDKMFNAKIRKMDRSDAERQGTQM